MIVKVHMLAFGKPNEIREVEVPSGCPCCPSTLHLLSETYAYGQNDIQPQQHPSVSVGDVIELHGRQYHRVARNGFVSMTDEEFEAHRNKPQIERVLGN